MSFESILDLSEFKHIIVPEPEASQKFENCEGLQRGPTFVLRPRSRKSFKN